MFEVKVVKVQDNSRKGEPIVIVTLGVFRKGSTKKSGNILVEVESPTGKHPVSAKEVREVLRKPNSDKSKNNLLKDIETELVSNANRGFFN